MAQSSALTRTVFAFASGLAIFALILHIQNWQKGAPFDWPTTMSMSGLIVLTTAGAIDPPRGWLRLTLSTIAVLLIFTGSAAQFLSKP